MEKTIETKAEGWKGSITLKMPSVIDRLKYAKLVDVEKIQEASQADQIDMIIRLVEIASNHIVSVDLNYEDRVDVKSWEELQCYQEGLPVMLEIGTSIMQGLSLGKTSSP